LWLVGIAVAVQVVAQYLLEIAGNAVELWLNNGADQEFGLVTVDIAIQNVVKDVTLAESRFKVDLGLDNGPDKDCGLVFIDVAIHELGQFVARDNLGLDDGSNKGLWVVAIDGVVHIAIEEATDEAAGNGDSRVVEVVDEVVVTISSESNCDAVTGLNKEVVEVIAEVVVGVTFHGLGEIIAGNVNLIEVVFNVTASFVGDNLRNIVNQILAMLGRRRKSRG
jgi:hypothetical protein